MHNLWPIGLNLTLIVALSGCFTHSSGQAHQTDAHPKGQAHYPAGQAQKVDPAVQKQAGQHGQAQRAAGHAQCPESDQTGCVGQSPSKTNLDMQPPNRTEPINLTYLIDEKILDTSSQRFVAHSGDAKFESYLAQNIPFEQTELLRKQIEVRFGTALKHRGEAHITVVTPPEFERLSSYLSIETINAMVIESIQNMPYQIVCLGIGEIADTDTTMLTFFIVVKSIKLSELREQFKAAYLQAGGPAPAFRTVFRPHITIGFTHRDLHESDGINKNETACVSEIMTDVSPD